MISCFPEFSESLWRRRFSPLRSNWRKADSKEPHHSLVVVAMVVVVLVKPRHSLVGSQLLNVETPAVPGHQKLAACSSPHG